MQRANAERRMAIRFPPIQAKVVSNCLPPLSFPPLLLNSLPRIFQISNRRPLEEFSTYPPNPLGVSLCLVWAYQSPICPVLISPPLVRKRPGSVLVPLISQYTYIPFISITSHLAPRTFIPLYIRDWRRGKRGRGWIIDTHHEKEPLCSIHFDVARLRLWIRPDESKVGKGEEWLHFTPFT